MIDVRSIGAYGITEAAHYLSLPSATLRSWVRGYNYQVSGERRFSDPLIKLPDKSEPLLSFTNVVEAHVLAAIRRRHEIPMQKVRPALDYLEGTLGRVHPLAHEELLTDGVSLFVENLGQIINLSRSGQLGIKELIRAHLERVSHDRDGFAGRLFPFTRPQRETSQPRVVVLDPRVSFGRPSISGTSVRTEVVACRLKTGESIDEIAADYNLSEEQIQEAIRYELAA